jgi:hypothetical protein
MEPQKTLKTQIDDDEGLLHFLSNEINGRATGGDAG